MIRYSLRMKLNRIYFNRNEEDQLASKRNSTLLRLIRPRKIHKSNWALFLPRGDVTLPLKQANFSIFYHIIIYYYPFFLNNFLGYLLLTESKMFVIKKFPLSLECCFVSLFRLQIHLPSPFVESFAIYSCASLPRRNS